MAGKHIHVSNPGASVDYFASLPSGNLILPLLPSLPYTTVSWSYPESGAFFVAYDCLQNSNAFPVTANYYFADSDDRVTSQSVVIPPYGLYLGPPANLPLGLGVLYMTLSASIRMAQFNMEIAQLSGPPTMSVDPPAQVTSLGLLGLNAAPGTFSWIWQVGTPAPQPQATTIFSGFPFTVSLSGGAQAWLKVTPTSGVDGTQLTLTPIISNLGVGNYTGTITLTEQLPPDLAQFGPSSTSFNVTLDATVQSALLYSNNVEFLMNVGGPAPAPATVPITSNGTPAAFTTSITGARWLTVTPTSGTTPATLTLTVNPAGLAPGTYNASVVLQGPVNTVDVPVGLQIGPGLLQVSPTLLTFSLPAGQAAPSPLRILFVESPLPLTVATSTQSGGNWLSASVANPLMVGVSASAASLGAGTYQGTVTITTSAGNVASVPVTLTVTPPAGTPQPSVSPSSLTLSAPVGTAATGILNVTGVPSFTIQSTSGTILAQYLVTPPSTTGQFTTPATIQITTNPSQAGTYRGAVTLAWTGGSATIPITDYATASKTAPPVINTIVGSGSATPGSIAPGELITIYGQGLGAAPTGFGKIGTDINGTQVSINGTAAPLIYASTGQVNAIVPYEIGTGMATVQVTAGGIQAGAWAVPITPSAPSIFTVSSAGVGQGAVVNADGSVNSATNPAARGSAIQIYATGGGQTSPASTTGTVAQGAANLTLPITVTIGGLSAQVLYAGSAPGEVEGVIQINAIVPLVTPDPMAPLVVTIGGVTSQTGVTIAVRAN
jgi:trimeric autotransporter adhesin